MRLLPYERMCEAFSRWIVICRNEKSLPRTGSYVFGYESGFYRLRCIIVRIRKRLLLLAFSCVEVRESPYLVAFTLLLSRSTKSVTHIAICTRLDAGVLRPMVNSVAPGRRLTSSTTGTRTKNAPVRP